MKLFILALFSLILAVSSESEKSKSKAAKDLKIETSAFLQKFLTPLNHDVNQRYGTITGMNYGLNREDLIKNLMRNDRRYYDYLDDYDEDHDDLRLRHDGRSRGPHNVPNIWGYSRNGGMGNLVNHAYNGDPNVWGYLRNSEGKMRNTEQRMRNSEEGKRNMDIYNRRMGLGQRHEGRMRHMERVHMRPGNMAHMNMMGPEIMGYGNMEQRNMGYGNMGQEDMGNIRLENMLLNINALLEPDHIGYVGQVHPKGMGIKERHNFAMVGPRELERRRPMSHGLITPMTPSPLGMFGRKQHMPQMSQMPHMPYS